MRILLDEDIPIQLRFHFQKTVNVETVEYRGWKGLKNGALLHAAHEHFDVLVTMDNNIPDQQSIQRFKLSVVILRAPSKRLEDLLKLMPELESILSELRFGQAVRIYPPE